jgi:hypothetical protein
LSRRINVKDSAYAEDPGEITDIRRMRLLAFSVGAEMPDSGWWIVASGEWGGCPGAGICGVGWVLWRVWWRFTV